VIDLILANTASIPGSVPKISITPSSVIGSSLITIVVPVVFVILESLFHQVQSRLQ
jgi:hypothetical protein